MPFLVENGISWLILIRSSSSFYLFALLLESDDMLDGERHPPALPRPA